MSCTRSFRCTESEIVCARIVVPCPVAWAESPAERCCCIRWIQARALATYGGVSRRSRSRRAYSNAVLIFTAATARGIRAVATPAGTRFAPDPSAARPLPWTWMLAEVPSACELLKATSANSEPACVDCTQNVVEGRFSFTPATADVSVGADETKALSAAAVPELATT